MTAPEVPEGEEQYPVKLYVYDLSNGLARTLSPALLGIQIDAVWHTSIVVHDTEVFFSASHPGVHKTVPGGSHHGSPLIVEDLGTTQLPPAIVKEFLADLQQEYKGQNYDLFKRNCNHFTNELAEFLVGKGIPSYITDLVDRVLETEFGKSLRPMVENWMKAQTDVPEPEMKSSDLQ